MSMEINIGDLQRAIREELKAYSEEIAEEAKKAADETAEELLQNISRDAPARSKGSKSYKGSMRLKTISENATEKHIRWYVEGGKGNITHLLEDGHEIFVGTAKEKRGKRTGTKQVHKQGGTVRAYPHIRNNEAIAKENLNRRVKEVIYRAGH